MKCPFDTGTIFRGTVSHCYYETYNHTMPWSEEQHGAKGLLEYYGDFFDTKDNEFKTLSLLNFTVSNSNVYLPSNLCPCWSGKHVRHCHKDRVIELRKLGIKDILKDELTYLAKELKKIFEGLSVEDKSTYSNIYKWLDDLVDE